jgi:uncharacterized protein
LGIVSALIIELTFIPALRASLKPAIPPACVMPSKPTAWEQLSDRICVAVLRYRVAVLASFAFLAALSSFGLSHLNQENSTKSYFGETAQVRQDDKLLNNKLAGTNTLYVMFRSETEDRMKDPAVLSVIDEAQQFIQSQPDVGKTISIVDFLKQMNRAMNGGESSAHRLPATKDAISQYLLLYSISGEPTDFDSYIDYGYKNANLIVWMKNDTSSYANKLLHDVRAFVEPRLPPGVTLQIGGSAPQTAALSQVLVEGKLKNVTQIIVVVFFAGLLVFRSVLAALYIVVPLLITVLVNFGVMGLTGIPLNTPNSVVSALAIGIGADYSIYLMYRIREEFSQTGDLESALRRSIRTAGVGIIYVVCAVVGGYSVLLLSFNFYIHIWFGILIVLSMLVSAVSSLALVPVLIKLWPPRELRSEPPSTQILPTMARSIVPIAALLFFMGLADSREARAAEVPADTIMERSYQSSRLKGSISEATFRLVTADGQERVRKTFGASKLANDGVGNKRVIRFLSPSDVRNAATLLVETADGDDISVYLPVLKKVRRLARNNKSSSFIGTDLSYGDLIGHKPAEWTHKLLRRETLDGTRVFVVESVPRSKSVAEDSGYGRRMSWISEESWVQLKGEFFDSAGAPLKTIAYADVRPVDTRSNKYQAMRVSVKNVQTGHQTFIVFDRFKSDDAVNEAFFSTRYLEKEE